MCRRFLFICCLLISFFANAQTGKQLNCDSLTQLGGKYYQAKNYKEAINTFFLIIDTCKTLNEEDKCYMIFYIERCYLDAGDFKNAIAAGEDVTARMEKIKRTNTIAYIMGMFYLASAYESIGKYTAAIECYEIAINKTPTDERKKEYYSWYALHAAECYTNTSQYVKSMKLNMALKAYIKNLFTENHVMYLRCIANIATTYNAMLNYDSALVYQKQEVELAEKKFGKDNTEYFFQLANLATIYRNMENYPDAVALYERTKLLFENNKQTNTFSYASLLANMGDAYLNLNQYDKGQDLILYAYDIARKISSVTDLQLSEFILKIANMYALYGTDKGKPVAIKNFFNAKCLIEKDIGKNNERYINVLRKIGRTYNDANMYDSALYWLNEYLVEKKMLNNKDDETVANALNDLADTYLNMNNYAESFKKYNESINILKNLYGNKSPLLATVFNNFALAYIKSGSYIKADSLFNESYLIIRNHILNNTEGLSESEKESFVNDIKWANWLSANNHIKHPQLNLPNNFLLNEQLFYKGLLLESQKGFVKSFKNNKDTTIQNKLKEYLYLKSLTGKEQLKPVKERDSTMEQMQNKIALLERELLQQSANYRNWKNGFNVTFNNIQQKLKANEVAIEFIAYPTPDMDSLHNETKYAALVLTKEMQSPALVYLFAENQFNKLIIKSNNEAVVKKLYRSSVKNNTIQPTDSLYNLIWKPLLPYIKNINTVYFSADGVINNLNLAAIITPEGKRLVELYELIQLNSTKTIVKEKQSLTFNNIQLWGGINYGNSASTNATERSGAFNYLPGTLNEINDIASIKHNTSQKIKTIIADNANEIAFKSLSGNSPEVLHIATHGFFFQDPEKTTIKNESKFSKAQNPLLRSGLALYNANASWKENMVSSDKEDGVLTAYEIADLDLSNTKLVVLSACETGLGDVKSGEGVYGLQRAFKMAGVDYLIMSLWQVPDMETKEFMQTFYTNCFAGMPIRKAFRETQLAMNKKYQPYQWAAFVLVE